MLVNIENLGKVSPTVEKDYWSKDKDYDRLVIVQESASSFKTYISRKPVQAGIELSNRNYWIPFSSLQEDISGQINSLQEILNDYWSNLPNAISFKGSISEVPVGDPQVITLTFSSIKPLQSPANIKIYKNNVLFVNQNITSNTFIVNDSVNMQTVYRCVVTIDGFVYCGSWEVLQAIPFYVGAGITYTDVIDDEDCKYDGVGDIARSYQITAESNDDYFYIIYRSDRILGRVTMNGFDIPMDSLSLITINNISYFVYVSSNKYAAGTYFINIGNNVNIDNPAIGDMKFDSTRHPAIPLWWNGNAWVNANGVMV